jgi:hypothetical protein
MLRAEHDAHVGAFGSFCRNVIKHDETVDNFFSTQLTILMKLSDIKTTIITLKQTRDNIAADFPAIAARLDKLEITHKENINTVYSEQHGILV